MHYVWLIWSSLLLLIWVLVYLSLKNKESKRKMFIMSLWTSLLGFTEPLFVPLYWNPPSLFNLAQNTGFDIESFLFAFGIGGIVVIIYDKFFHGKQQVLSMKEKHNSHHKYHLLALFSAPIIFFLLIFFAHINPIYSAFIALMCGGFATWYCRPDLKKKMFTSAFLFLIFYFLYFSTLNLVYPGYVEQVWNFSTISGIIILGVPLEELMFAFGIGFFWSSIYEHITWHKIMRN